MSTLILNDVHIGPTRVAGTTIATQAQIRSYIQEAFRDMLTQHAECDVVIPGDLLDAFVIDSGELMELYRTLSGFLTFTNKELVLGAGNHDIGKRSDRLSSFGFLAYLLKDRFPRQVTIVDSGLVTYKDNIHIISHCMNQDLFDIELEKALTVEPGYLLLHANADNGFTEESDHSLNVDAVTLEKLSKIHHVLFAHEHQGRTLDYGYKKITVLGNQWPTSISDCLTHGEAQKSGRKFAHIISETGEFAKIETWNRKDDYAEIEWTELSGTTTDARFVRVTGNASATQASEVVSAIAKYRMNSPALVIGNAVKIEGVKGVDEMAQISLESVTSYDVMGALMEMLEPREQKIVKGLLDATAN